jgi:hypothetical protein
VTAGYYQDYSPRAFQAQSGVFRDVLRAIVPAGQAWSAEALIGPLQPMVSAFRGEADMPSWAGHVCS